MPLYRVTMTLAVDVDMPDRGEAVQTANEMLEDIRERVFAPDEKVIKTSTTIRKRRDNGELNDEGVT